MRLYRTRLPGCPGGRGNRVLEAVGGDWANRVRVLLHHAKTGELFLDESGHNLVTYAGRTAFLKWIQYGHADQGGSLRYIGVGTGTTAPALADTALGSEELRKAITTAWDNINIGSVSPDGPEMIASVMFLADEANDFITEFAAFQSAAAGVMFNRAFLDPDQGTITGATQANPCVITSAAHGLSNDHKVKIEGVTGMTQLNGNVYTVAGATTDTYQLSGIDSSAYGAFAAASPETAKWTRGIQKTSDYVMTVLMTIANIPS